ncbi:MAG: hypothetical protein JWO38_3057 [Gemmataceae bacterium]|nr:hypothetical protein [Gemmataceae bacterium]
MDEPLRLRTQMDIAVDLTAALSTRMKPPPKPPRDLKPSTALWILATGVAIALLLLTLISANDFSDVVLYIGAGQIAAGYLWVVSLAFRRDWQRGLVCAIPPITLWYLAQWKYAKYRPLRSVATGAVLMGIAATATYVLPHTRSWAGVNDDPATTTTPPDITTQSKVAQLRHYRDKREYDALIELLRTLARTDPRYSDEAKNRVELAAELKALCGHTDAGVKVEGMAAFAAWGGDDARGLCLEASRSANREERLMALRLLPRWKDEYVARALAERVGRPGRETTSAQDALVELGGPVAERAVIPLLRNEEQGIRLTAIDILGNEKVGGSEAVAALLEVARTTNDPGTRQRAVDKADQIRNRLKK